MEARAGPFVMAATAVRVIAVANTRSRFCNFGLLMLCFVGLVRSNGTRRSKFIHGLSQGRWFGELSIPGLAGAPCPPAPGLFSCADAAQGIVAVLRGPRPDVNLGIERLSLLIQNSRAAVVSPDGVAAF